MTIASSRRRLSRPARLTVIVLPTLVACASAPQGSASWLMLRGCRRLSSCFGATSGAASGVRPCERVLHLRRTTTSISSSRSAPTCPDPITRRATRGKSEQRGRSAASALVGATSQRKCPLQAIWVRGKVSIQGRLLLEVGHDLPHLDRVEGDEIGTGCIGDHICARSRSFLVLEQDD